MPAMVRIAASRSAVFRSGSLRTAIARSSSRVSVPAPSCPGRAEPSRPSARLMRNDVGGELERERPVVEHRDDRGHDVAALRSAHLVVAALHLHEVHAGLAEHLAELRDRGGARGELQRRLMNGSPGCHGSERGISSGWRHKRNIDGE